MVESASEKIDPGFKSAIQSIEPSSNVDGENGSIHQILLDVVLVGCSHELKDQKKLDIIED